MTKQKNPTTSYFGIMAEGEYDLKLVPEYNGTMSVVDWLERVDLICKLLGVDKVEQVIPLQLARGAFDVYQQLSDANKTNVTWVKAALCRAFALDHVEAYTAHADVCSQKLSDWCRKGSDVSVLDLRKAYLQVHVHRSL